MKNHNHDLVHHLSETIDSLWRYDEYVKNSQGCDSCSAMWSKMKQTDMEVENMLRAEIQKHIDEKRFD